ncbi:alpha-hydroxy-acid oxidizing protein [Streptomyces griseoluteus]|uniref:Alpha-hydroxy-acid oxidizing protein n=1 Tax=Streptomyces griseoluteus TaxID=29306 RepID=A0A4Z1D868_STRGP|nr:alpha-hydroxy-acid oxidizing protein [Streptomyces griseoluteus]
MTSADARRAAASVLPQGVWDFLEGGSGSEATLAANRAAFDDLFLVPRVLADVSGTRTAATVLGAPAAMPVGIAPMAYQRLFHPDGESAAAQAAETAGVPYVAGMLSTYALEEITAVCSRTWLQLYWLRDRVLLTDLIDRAEAAGCTALVLTVDVPRMARRLRDMRNAFTLPPDIVAANFPATATRSARRGEANTSAVMVHTSEAFDPTLTWNDVAWLRGQTELPLVLKGVLHPEDAARAAGLGVDAVVVSNHGGRQLDGAVPALNALAAVCAAVEGSTEVFLDGGVRGGTDVLKALALGATAVLTGRPVLWGLSADGQRGVERVLSLLRAELEDALALSGCADVSWAKGLTVVSGNVPLSSASVRRGPRW